MHRDFRKLLNKATGYSEFVIAANIDIRGFSSFSTRVESTDAAIFIKKIYMKLLDKYFRRRSFFKPTGDGLLIMIPYREGNLRKVIPDTIETCLQVLTDFGSLCAKEPMINFEVPQKVGIGLSRGSACCLVSEDKKLDYSGKPLNLASRLMDLARPSGIVFDAGFGIELLPPKLQKMFKKESIFLPGVHESEPIDVYYTKEYTEISPKNKHPIKEVKWNSIEDTKTLREIRDLGPNFIYDMPSKPIDPNQIRVKIIHQALLRGRVQRGVINNFYFDDFEYFTEAGKPELHLRFHALAKRLEFNEVRDGMKVGIHILYPET